MMRACSRAVLRANSRLRPRLPLRLQTMSSSARAGELAKLHRDVPVERYRTLVGHWLARGLSYVVRGPGPSMYLCGDSGYFSGFADVGERFAPDLALLPIGGFMPSSFRSRHMSPLDAHYAFEDLRARLLVPIHHGAFALSYERLDEPARWLVELATSRGLREHVLVMA